MLFMAPGILLGASTTLDITGDSFRAFLQIRSLF